MANSRFERSAAPAAFLPLATFLFVATTCSVSAAGYQGMPEGEGSYADLVELYDEFLTWKDPAKARREQPLRDVAGSAADVFPDYGAAAVEERRRKLVRL